MGYIFACHQIISNSDRMKVLNLIGNILTIVGHICGCVVMYHQGEHLTPASYWLTSYGFPVKYFGAGSSVVTSAACMYPSCMLAT